MSNNVGVEIYERSIGMTTTIDNSYYAAFVGKDFTMGEANKAVLITSLADYKRIFGLPNNTNFNEWYQVENYLRNAGAIYVTRAVDENGATNLEEVTVLDAAALEDDFIITVADASKLYVNAFIDLNGVIHTITEINGLDIEITPPLEVPLSLGDKVKLATPSYNAINEIEMDGGTAIDVSLDRSVLRVIPNAEEYQNLELSLPFTSLTNTKLRITAKNPGSWANNVVKVAIAKPSDFLVSTNTAFGNSLSGYYEYPPSAAENEIAILTQNALTGETNAYTVTLTPGSKDPSGRSTYIEDVINAKDGLIFVKDNTSVLSIASKINGDEIELQLGEDGKPGKDEIVRQYQEVYGNAEEISIDFFIANELANVEVVSFASSLGETVAIAGARYEDCVGLKREKAVENVYKYMTTGDFNINDKYGVFYGNYIEIYDIYNDKNRWVNVAGMCAGLRAKVNYEVGPWGASFGLEQYGQITGINKIAFNPDKQQRDLLYKVHCNPIVSFPGQGTVIFGNKTMLRKNEPFSKIHVRTAFNAYQKAIRKSAKYVIGKPNDNITRSLFSSTVNPVFETAQAKRGIVEFAIYYPPITDDRVMEAVFYIKPMGIVETIRLYFTAVDNSVEISEVIGRA